MQATFAHGHHDARTVYAELEANGLGAHGWATEKLRQYPARCEYTRGYRQGLQESILETEAAKAEQKAESQPKPRPNRLVIRVSGGVVQGASADDPTLEVIVVDEDNIRAGDAHPFGDEEACAEVISQMTAVY